jgi:hypothetical protein
MNAADPQVQPKRMRPTALPVADAGRLLAAVGGSAVTPEMIHADMAVGAPANTDGTVNLVHYAAWLVKEMSSGGD